LFQRRINSVGVFLRNKPFANKAMGGSSGETNDFNNP
jgi:hypothetical protein